LLAHSHDGSEALVQHGTEFAAYLYRFGEVRTYTLVPMDFTVQTTGQAPWAIDYGDRDVIVSTGDQLEVLTRSFVGEEEEGAAQ